MKELIFGISGVRGIVGETLTPEIVMKIGMAFGNYIMQNAKVLIGRDARESGEMLKEAFVKGLKVKGEKLKVVDMGVITTPGLLFNIKELEASRGVVITASHNPPEWNGIKFANAEGIFLDAEEVEKVYEIYKGLQIIDYRLQDYKIARDEKGEERHIAGVMRVIDAESIRNRHFKVVIDSFIDEGRRFLEELGCQVICENSERGFEPVAENLVNLSRRVKEIGADIGFATDPDGDRLSIVTEKGKALGEEYTLPLVASGVFKKLKVKSEKLKVVTNLSTSRMIDDVVAQNNGRVIRTKVGEINVVKEMLKSQAVFGGEGNGGIIDPQIQYTRDALVGMGRILDYMTNSGEKISTLASRIPRYYMVKEKVEVQDARYKMQDMIKLFPEGKINRKDGVRIDFKEGWVHLRKSNTEPILRIVCETKNKNLTNSIVGTILNKMC